MAKGSGQQSSALLGMAPLFIYLFSAAFPPSFKTPVMLFTGCSSVCQCHSVLCAGKVKHTLINLDSVLAAGVSAKVAVPWCSPWVPACPEQELWLVLPAWSSLLSSLWCTSASSEFWLLMDISKRERKPPFLLPHSKQGWIWQQKKDICGGVVWAASCWARVPFSSFPLGWRSCSKMSCNSPKWGSPERQGCNNPVV